MFNFLRNLYSAFLGGHTIIPLQAKHKGSDFSASSPILFIFYFLKNYSYLNGCEMVSHHDFDLHFPND